MHKQAVLQSMQRWKSEQLLAKQQCSQPWHGLGWVSCAEAHDCRSRVTHPIGAEQQVADEGCSEVDKGHKPKSVKRATLSCNGGSLPVQPRPEVSIGIALDSC